MTTGFDLREWISKEIRDPGTSWSVGAFGAVAEFSRDSDDHRVFLSRVGRAEVYQAIPLPDAKRPDGPHTHVLPKLLRAGRTHSANDPYSPWLGSLCAPLSTASGKGCFRSSETI
jgi:hypothetical protein